MKERQRIYIAIDLKSFYASVECVARGLDPLTTNLVVADESRTEKTICLAVSPSLKAYGVPGRARLFEVIQQVKRVNAVRSSKAPGSILTYESADDNTVKKDSSAALGYIIARPRMAKYMEVSTKVYGIYLKYIAPEDIHVYSVDEVFIDATEYLELYAMSPGELAMMMIQDVLKETGITATAGIGTNLYLAKIAMDIEAKHIKADINGVRIAELDEILYRYKLWNHTPITDFWRIGRGYAKKLAQHQMFTMGDVARCSLGKPNEYYNEELLYKLFGVNAELLIDHAWGWEPVTIADIKAYKPETNSLSSGQVLSCAVNFDTGRLIMREMTDLLSLDLVDKDLVTDQLVLTIFYDRECLKNPNIARLYNGPVERDHYGRLTPKKAHGSINIGEHTSSTSKLMEYMTELYESIVDKNLLVRRIYVVANHVIREEDIAPAAKFEQLDLFTDYNELEKQRKLDAAEREKERRRQKAVLEIKKKYGKNAILKGMNFEEGATARERNAQIGGHKA